MSDSSDFISSENDSGDDIFYDPEEEEVVEISDEEELIDDLTNNVPKIPDKNLKSIKLTKTKPIPKIPKKLLKQKEEMDILRNMVKNLDTGEQSHINNVDEVFDEVKLAQQTMADFLDKKDKDDISSSSTDEFINDIYTANTPNIEKKKN